MTFAVVTDALIDESRVRFEVESQANGAAVVFLGIVRNHDEGRDILSLDYQAHPDAERILRECCEQVSSDTGLVVAAAHRVGSLQIGDVALCAAVGSAHRKESFEACQLLVDRIKTEVPIWKKQHYLDGESEWVGL